MVKTTTLSPLDVLTTRFGRDDLLINNKLDEGEIIAEDQNVVQILSDVGHWIPDDSTVLIHALVTSFSVIIVSELGDKTFILTAIMAMKNSRSIVFLGSALALLIMTVLSVVMGVAVTVIPKVYTHYASIILFTFFGFKMFKEAYDMSTDSPDSDFDAVEKDLERDISTVKDNNATLCANLSAPEVKSVKDIVEISQEADKKKSYLSRLTSTLNVTSILVKVFTMVFVAEWGDRSQISTVLLSAREDIVGVFVGSFVGHLLCTGLAVVGGRFVADMISVRTMAFLGGIVFLIFAVAAIISGPE